MGANALPRILSQLHSCTQTKPDQWQAACPVHKGGKEADRSFGIRIDATGRVLLNCFTGCQPSDIWAALGVTARDLAPDDGAAPDLGAVPIDPRPTPEEWEAHCEQWSANFKGAPAARSGLAGMLGLPESVFDQFPGIGARLGRSDEHPEGHPNGACWTFPERDAAGRIVGVALRFKDGTKRVETGSARGLSVPAGWAERPGPLYLPEGVTDTLALTAAGCAAIGRPGLNTGIRTLAELVCAQVPTARQLIWLGENDRDDKTGKWPGRDASLIAAAKFAAEVPGHTVLFALPPNLWQKDVRGWACGLVSEGLLWSQVADRLKKGLKPRIVKPAAPAPPPPPPSLGTGTDGRCRVCLDSNHQKAVNDSVIEQLAKDPNLYARGNMLVRIIAASRRVVYRGHDGDGRPIPVFVIPGQTRLSAVQIPTLREKISDVVDFYKTGPKGDREKDVPDWCVAAIHAREEWPALKNLTALVEYPVLRPDGTIVCTHGHDQSTGVFYNHAAGVTIPTAPTRDDALAAWGRLSEVICDFPFEQPVHRAAWLAGLLTPMTRFAFNGCVPVFLIDGNVAGAGKGLLADTISLILTGRPFATMGYTDDDTEMSKRITAIGIEGEQLVLFDNINQGFGGASIDRALTSLEWSERILGQSKNIKCPLRVGWYGTGNNIELMGDILRRLCQIRLESPHDKPEERRNFRHKDLRAWIMVNRDALLADAATIIAAYYACGAPQAEIKQWGSFEAWSGVVRQVVTWLGLPDPMDTRDHLLEDGNPNHAAMRTIVGNWRKFDVAGQGMTASQIIETVYGASGNSIPPHLEDVADAIRQLSAKPTGRSLGQIFRKNRATRFNGMYLDQMAEDRNGSVRWIVRSSETKKVVSGIKIAEVVEPAGNAGFAGDKTNQVDQNASAGDPPTEKTDGFSMKTIPAIPALPPPKPPGTGFSSFQE